MRNSSLNRDKTPLAKQRQLTKVGEDQNSLPMHATATNPDECLIPEDFLSLCKTFPPRPIRKRADYRTFLSIQCHLKESIDRTNRDQRDYLDLLTLVIQRYEGVAVSSKPKPLSLLKQLVDEHKLSKGDLSKILGRSISLGSMILSGQRKITREHAVCLGKYFGMAPEPFLS